MHSEPDTMEVIITMMSDVENEPVTPLFIRPPSTASAMFTISASLDFSSSVVSMTPSATGIRNWFTFCTTMQMPQVMMMMTHSRQVLRASCRISCS